MTDTITLPREMDEDLWYLLQRKISMWVINLVCIFISAYCVVRSVRVTTLMLNLFAVAINAYVVLNHFMGWVS